MWLDDVPLVELFTIVMASLFGFCLVYFVKLLNWFEFAPQLKTRGCSLAPRGLYQAAIPTRQAETPPSLRVDKRGSTKKTPSRHTQATQSRPTWPKLLHAVESNSGPLQRATGVYLASRNLAESRCTDAPRFSGRHAVPLRPPLPSSAARQSHQRPIINTQSQSNRVARGKTGHLTDSQPYHEQLRMSLQPAPRSHHVSLVEFHPRSPTSKLLFSAR